MKKKWKRAVADVVASCASHALRMGQDVDIDGWKRNVVKPLVKKARRFFKEAPCDASGCMCRHAALIRAIAIDVEKRSEGRIPAPVAYDDAVRTLQHYLANRN